MQISHLGCLFTRQRQSKFQSSGVQVGSATIRSEQGSMLPLMIFYCALCMVLVFVVIAATSLYLERKRLFTLADGASLVGAEAFSLDDLTVTEHGTELSLDSAKVAEAATEYLQSIPTAEFDDFSIDQAASIDGKSATVSLSANWKPPVVTLILPEGIRLQVTATSRSVFSR
ncbi:MAG: Tad domain-containing protein [Microbacteriaceae bacterium]|nr:Tad domain-containing protein [Microbacteriaceae bacterium]